MFKNFPFSLTKLGAACGVSAALLAMMPALAQAQTPAAPVVSADTAGIRNPEMTLQAAASAEVKQDTVHMTLSVEVEASDQASAGNKLASSVDAVVKRARGAKNITVSTGIYQVWPNTNSKGKIIGWRGQGQLILESQDFDAVGALAAKLGDKTSISGVSFSLSRQAQEAEERKLLSQAAQAFKERALAAANAFGFSGYKLSRIDVGGSGGFVPAPRMAALSAAASKDSASFANVPLEAGETTVSMSISGTIVLQ